MELVKVDDGTLDIVVEGRWKANTNAERCTEHGENSPAQPIVVVENGFVDQQTINEWLQHTTMDKQTGGSNEG